MSLVLPRLLRGIIARGLSGDWFRRGGPVEIFEFTSRIYRSFSSDTQVDQSFSFESRIDVDESFSSESPVSKSFVFGTQVHLEDV